MQLFIATIFALLVATANSASTDIGDALSMSMTDAKFEASASILAAGTCLAETNAARARNGRGPLIADTRLETAARNHNNVMVAQNCFSHQCPGEPSFGDRITAAGYTWGSAGENIAAGYANCNAAVDGWMNSQGHRDNILTNNVHLGCHMATCNSGCNFRTYFTCEYARPR